jgi:DNA-binding MarR family transcriptional regulator
MVDRLETAGLAERRPKAGDRRVKLVALTPAGVKVKAELQAGIYQPPPELLHLPRRVLASLREAASRLPTLPRGEAAHAGMRGGERRRR